jgi:hypothetical protein
MPLKCIRFILIPCNACLSDIFMAEASMGGGYVWNGMQFIWSRGVSPLRHWGTTGCEYTNRLRNVEARLRCKSRARRSHFGNLATVCRAEHVQLRCRMRSVERLLLGLRPGMWAVRAFSEGLLVHISIITYSLFIIID